MQTTLKAAVESYLRAKTLSRGTCNEYFSTLRKWEQWGGGSPIEDLQRKDVREFLDWVHVRAVAEEGTNPGRTANKAREHLRAVLSWAWEQELIDSPPRFPKPREQRDVAGRHYLTKAEISALYFATHSMPRPRGWANPVPVGRYWRAALVLRKTCATYYDQHIPESSVEILGHSVGGITYRHYAHRAPLGCCSVMMALKAIVNEGDQAGA